MKTHMASHVTARRPQPLRSQAGPAMTGLLTLGGPPYEPTPPLAAWVEGRVYVPTGGQAGAEWGVA